MSFGAASYAAFRGLLIKSDFYFKGEARVQNGEGRRAIDGWGSSACGAAQEFEDRAGAALYRVPAVGFGDSG